MIDVIRAAFLAKVLREKELLRDTHWSGRSDWPKEGHCGCYECPHDGCSSDTCSAMDALEAECKAARADLDEVLAGGRKPQDGPHHGNP